MKKRRNKGYKSPKIENRLKWDKRKREKGKEWEHVTVTLKYYTVDSVKEGEIMVEEKKDQQRGKARNGNTCI